MAETISPIGLFLMLAALAPLAVRWARCEDSAVRTGTVLLVMTGLVALTVLFWRLAYGWAGEARPLLPTLAAIVGLVLLLPLPTGVLRGRAPGRLEQPSYGRRTFALYRLLIPLLIYCLACWSTAAWISIRIESPLEGRFWLYAVCLAPGIFAITLPNPPSLQHDAFLAVCLEWLYAAGCWGLVVIWASFSPGAAGAAALGWAVVACAVAGLLWAFLTGTLQIGGRAARAVVADNLLRLPGATAARLRETGEVLVFIVRALGRGLVRLPAALATAVARLVTGVGWLLLRTAALLLRALRDLALAWLVLLSAASRGLLALPGATWRLLVRCASAVTIVVAASWRAIGAVPPAVWLVVRRLTSGFVAISAGIGMAALASIRWLAHAVPAAAVGIVRALARLAHGLGRAVVASPPSAGRGLKRAGRALKTRARAVGEAILAVPPALWTALRRFAAGLAHVVTALALLAQEMLRWIARLPLLLARLLLRLGRGLILLGQALLALPAVLWNVMRMWVTLTARLLDWLVRASAGCFRWLRDARRRLFPAFGRTLRARPWAPAVVIVPSIAVAAWLTLRPPPPPPPLRIVAGSGFASFEPILKRWGQENGFDVQVSYKGSLDIMLMLESGNIKADAIWEGDSMWTSLGDKLHVVKTSKSIMCSPIVFGIKRSLAEEFGWIGRDVGMQEILDAAEKRRLRVLMTSASQSNSGASAYFGFLYAFAGQPEVLTAEHLEDQLVRDKVRRTLGSINRTSESSGWMRDLFLKRYAHYDAMFNYESHILEMNQQLVARGDEPLYIIYPAEGLGMADFPFSLVRTSTSDPAKEQAVQKLQDYLLRPSVQAEIATKGRRVGPLCDQVDPAIFRPEWGADSGGIVNSLNYPAEPVIRQALDLYQADFRKPSFTVYALDFSASMEGEGKQKLIAAMRTLLDQKMAAKYLLQAAPNDVTAVVVFDDDLMNDPAADGWTVKGNDGAALAELLGKIERQPLGHFTNIYLPVQRALELIQAEGVDDRFPAIILLTDGQSNRGSLEDVRKLLAATGLDVPVYGITFGEADADQLNALADLTAGRVFDGSKDLVGAFRKAKGQN